MLKNALKAKRGESVASAALWEEHAELGRQIEERQRAKREFESASGDDLIEALAEQGFGNSARRREMRREMMERVDEINDLERARAAVAIKARAAEAREKKTADSGAWTQVDGLLRKRATVAAKIDRLLVEVATAYAEIQGIERQVFEVMPRDQRPTQFPRAGWDSDLGRGIALRLKLLQPAIDGLAGGFSLYVARDWPTIAGLAEIAHKAVMSGRK